MDFSASQTLDTQILAFATTIHLAAAALRNHRRVGGAPLSSLAAVSAVLAGAPWVLPSGAGVALGLALHAVWFAVCERWSVAPASAVAPVAGTAPRVPSPAPAERAVRTGRAARPSAAPTPKGFVATPVLSVLDETRDIRTFRVARPEGFAFTPGQFLTIRVRTDGTELVRCYSISSAPEASGYLEISVKRQGVVSGALHASARPGGVLSVRAPAGGFVYPADDRPLVLVAGGVGITPLMSMLRHAVLAEPMRPVTLLYSARSEDDLAFRDELVSLCRRSPRVRVSLAASAGATSPSVYPGRIDESLLRTIPDLRDSIACLCGPQSMIQTLSGALAELGLGRSQIRFELFEAAVAGSSKWREAHAEDGRSGVAGAATGVAGVCQMRATRSGRTIPVKAGETLLEASEAHGIAVPSLCRAGVCGTCRTRVVSGDVECASDLIDDEERQAGYVLACVATPRGDCAVEV